MRLSLIIPLMVTSFVSFAWSSPTGSMTFINVREGALIRRDKDLFRRSLESEETWNLRRKFAYLGKIGLWVSGSHLTIYKI